MVTKERKWLRWAGPRDEIVTAAKLAMTDLERWTSVPSKITCRIVYSGGLSEREANPDALLEVHRTDLSRIRQIWIDVEPDLAKWSEKAVAALDRSRALRQEGRNDEAATAEREADQNLVRAEVSMRFSSSFDGLKLEVEGPNRTDVEGLLKRLSDVLTRSASWPTWYPGSGGYWAPSAGLLLLGLFVGLGVSDALGYEAHSSGRLVAVLGGLVIGLLLGLLLGWAFPAVEILDENTRARFDRFRLWVVGAIVTVLLGVVSAVIYGLST